MQPEQQPITGNESQDGVAGPVQALIRFYDAFNNRNIEAMSENWHQSEEIAMDNPLGGIKRGWVEIRNVYAKIFNGPADVYVEFYDYTIHQGADMFYAVGRERGYFSLNAERIELAIRTSRVFRFIDGNWKQVHHHGSIEMPDLLARYQSAVTPDK